MEILNVDIYGSNTKNCTMVRIALSNSAMLALTTAMDKLTGTTCDKIEALLNAGLAHIDEMPTEAIA